MYVSNLTSGRSRSCGCGGFNIKHGLSVLTEGKRHPAYSSWMHMMNRCYNRKDPDWLSYGGRGIEVCTAWHEAAAFLRDMLPTWRSGLTIDRQDNNGNYHKDNCRWVTMKIQSRNHRRNVIVQTPTGPLVFQDAWKQYGKCARSHAQKRISDGMDSWLAISTPASRQNHKPPKS